MPTHTQIANTCLCYCIEKPSAIIRTLSAWEGYALVGIPRCRLIDSAQVATLAKFNGGMQRPEVPTAASPHPSPCVFNMNIPSLPSNSRSPPVSLSCFGVTRLRRRSTSCTLGYFGLVRPWPPFHAQASCCVDFGCCLSTVHLLCVVFSGWSTFSMFVAIRSELSIFTHGMHFEKNELCRNRK